jgi:uncharacterized protein (DUF2147 family)
MFVTLVATAALVAGAAPRPVGVWNISEADAQVRIAACGPAICGFPVSAPHPGDPIRTDVHNPDPALRERPMSSVQIFKLDLDADGAWRGWIYSPRNGHTYRATLRMESGDRLKLTGCLVRPLCSSQTWTRAPEGDAPP